MDIVAGLRRIDSRADGGARGRSRRGSARSLARLALALAGLGLASCGGSKETPWPANAAQYAVYATRIPLYPDAKIEDVMGSDTYGDDPGSHAEGMTWWYTVSDPRSKVTAWYEERLPGARKEVSDEGVLSYVLTPKGAEPGESMGVRIEEGKLRIFERTRAGKHKKG